MLVQHNLEYIMTVTITKKCIDAIISYWKLDDYTN